MGPLFISCYQTIKQGQAKQRYCNNRFVKKPQKRPKVQKWEYNSQIEVSTRDIHKLRLHIFESFDPLPLMKSLSLNSLHNIAPN